MSSIDPPTLEGVECLAGLAGKRVLIVGVDLRCEGPVAALLERLPQARVVSLTEGDVAFNVQRLPKRRLRTWLALAPTGWDAVIAAQDYRNLALLCLALPVRRRLQLRAGRLGPLRAVDVGRNELLHATRGLRKRWMGAQIPKPRGPGNDYGYIAEQLATLPGDWPRLRASVIVPVYNRRPILEKTLAGLELQDYPRDLFEVIVADDGSSDAPERVLETFGECLPVRIVRQEDRGYRLAEVRNLAIGAATGDVIVSLDCDMLPVPGFLRAMMRWFHATNESVVVIGYRNHVDTDRLTPDDIRNDFGVVRRLRSVPAPAAIRPRFAPTRDWRLPIFRRSRMLKTHTRPYSLASGGNVAYRRSDVTAVGGYDRDFAAWGGEDDELGYRLYRRGAYFIPEPAALAYHQDHPAAVDREADRKQTRQLLGRKVPHYRSLSVDGAWEAPKVSVYIPAYNASAWLQRAIDSALAQTLTDLEVCICDDGSSDGTAAILRAYRGNPRLRWQHIAHAGTAKASNAAIDLCRGEYLLQLDADDELLPEAAASLARILDDNPTAAIAFGGYERVVADGSLEKVVLPQPYAAIDHLHGNIIWPPRMFRARDFFRVGGFDASLASAEDFDLSLRLTERGLALPVYRVLYRYHIHGGNTSVVGSALQRECHQEIIRRALVRRRLDWELQVADPKHPEHLELRQRDGLAAARRVWRRRR